ncbi:unnamed protein product [Discosporangium mesarthrocarpum]
MTSKIFAAAGGPPREDGGGVAGDQRQGQGQGQGWGHGRPRAAAASMMVAMESRQGRPPPPPGGGEGEWLGVGIGRQGGGPRAQVSGGNHYRGAHTMENTARGRWPGISGQPSLSSTGTGAVGGRGKRRSVWKGQAHGNHSRFRAMLWAFRLHGSEDHALGWGVRSRASPRQKSGGNQWALNSLGGVLDSPSVKEGSPRPNEKNGGGAMGHCGLASGSGSGPGSGHRGEGQGDYCCSGADGGGSVSEGETCECELDSDKPVLGVPEQRTVSGRLKM